ncbi:MAG: AhpC/TSA family protein [Nocardioidaceae bacterium]
MHDAQPGTTIGLVAVGFSPANRLEAVCRHLGWDGLVLSDPTRRLYYRLGIGRAPWWRVYSPGTLVTYARAVAARQPVTKPDEDTRQLGGDAVMVDGTVTRLWRPRTPNDRPPAAEVFAAASAAGRQPR